jgi:hypothetical protein
MITVVSKRGTYKIKGKAIYIGRPSILGNPFAVSVHGHGVCIAMFRKWLWKQMQSDTEQHKEVLRLAELHKNGTDLTLVCWCKPKPCHGDVIKRAIEYLAK